MMVWADCQKEVISIADSEKRTRPPQPFSSDHGRLRRESRPETGIGAQIRKAAEEADARAVRQSGAPSPTEGEAELIAASSREPVRIYTTVLVSDLESGEQDRYTIVPPNEGDPTAGRISVGSPLGRALLEELPGAVVTVKTPGGKRRYRVLQVWA